MKPWQHLRAHAPLQPGEWQAFDCHSSAATPIIALTAIGDQEVHLRFGGKDQKDVRFDVDGLDLLIEFIKELKAQMRLNSLGRLVKS